MNRHRLLLVAFTFCISIYSSAQFSIGTWRDHLPYGKCVDVCEAGNIIFCATPYSIFTYNPSGEELFRINKTNFLTDVGITAMEYDAQSGYVVVGYENGNIDLITASSGVSIPDIKFSTIIGDKTIYDIYPYQNRVYLSTGFGVVVLDMNKLEVKETYFIGANGGPVRVNDLAIYNQSIYAVTETGIQTASLTNPFLANFQNWNEYSGLPSDTIATHIEFFNSHMMLSMPGTTADTLWRKDMTNSESLWQPSFPMDGLRIKQLWGNNEWLSVSGDYAFQLYHLNFNYASAYAWLDGNFTSSNTAIFASSGLYSADNSYGLLRVTDPTSGAHRYIHPEGPSTADCRRMGAYNDNIWIAHGGARADWVNMWKTTGFSGFVNDHWTWISADTLVTFNGAGCNPLNPSVSDIMALAVDPLDNNRVLAASWEEGLVEINATTRLGKTHTKALTEMGRSLARNSKTGHPAGQVLLVLPTPKRA